MWYCSTIDQKGVLLTNRENQVDDLYLLCGIAPPSIRRVSFSQIERTKQESDPCHSLFLHEPAPKRLKSRNNFLHAVADDKLHSCSQDLTKCLVTVVSLRSPYQREPESRGQLGSVSTASGLVLGTADT